MMALSPCKHFGECGGCQWQDVPYPEQLARKSNMLSNLLKDYLGAPTTVEPSPKCWHYRNKVDFNFGRRWYPTPPPEGFVRESVLGFKARGRWYRPLTIEECLIAPKGMTPLLESVRAWMGAQGLQAFDSRTRKGFLRVLLVREGRRTGDRMVVLITSDGDFDRASFVQAVLSAYPATNIQRGIFRGLADVAAAEEIELLYGTPTIDEELYIPDDGELKQLRFRLSPFSFFQTNTLGAERLYGFIRRWVRSVAPPTLYDLYGGGGGIALSCADIVSQICSVESVESASEDARYNASVNGVDNVSFITMKVESYLKETLQKGDMPSDSIVVVDPPRSGMHPKALRALLELRPREIFYISCKPSVFAKELPAFLDVYRLAKLQAFDLFPHTEHVELVSVLRLV